VNTVVALEADLADLILAAFIDHEDQIRLAFLAGRLNAMGNGDVGITIAEVVFLNIAPSFEDSASLITPLALSLVSFASFWSVKMVLPMKPTPARPGRVVTSAMRFTSAADGFC
jgi:hypothetical protein